MAKINIENTEVGGERAVRATFGLRNPVCLFLMLWLAGWSFGCYMILSQLFTKEFDVKLALFSIPFCAAEVIVACVVLVMLFGHTAIAFTKSGGTRFTGIGSLGYKKSFAFPENCVISMDETVSYGGKGRPVTIHRLVAKNASAPDGDPCVIYQSQNPAVVSQLCDIARDFLGSASVPAKGRDADPADAAAADDEAEAAAERQDRELLAGRPPSRVAVTRDFEGRIVVTLRRVWGMMLVVAIVVGVFSAVSCSKIWGSNLLPAGCLAGLCAAPALALLCVALFGKRSVTLDHGSGTTFSGVGGIGVRRRFEYGVDSEVRVAESDVAINHERMSEIVITNPGGKSAKLCTAWPNDVKPYIAAVIRHPSSVAATMQM